MIELTIKPDDVEPIKITATSRDILQWERRGRDRAFSKLMETLTISDIFEIAWLSMRRQGFIDQSMTMRDFESTHEVVFEGETENTGPTPPAP